MNFVRTVVYLSFISVILCYQQTGIEWKKINNPNHYYLNKDIQITIALKQNASGIETLKNYLLNEASNIDSSNYGKYLSIEEIDKYIKAPDDDRQKVKRWLIQNGVTECSYYGDAVKCIATISKINTLFNTFIVPHYNSHTGQIKYTCIKPYIIPRDLQSTIVFVDGICNKLYPKFPRKINQQNNGFVAREVVMRMYNVYPTFTGNQVSLGAMEYQGGDGFSNHDLNISQLANGVPTNPITANHIIGTKYSPDTESELDTQIMMWAASDVTGWYEDSPSWMYGWSVDFLHRRDVPEVVSISWGWSETDQCGGSVGVCVNETSKQYVERTNVEFMKIGLRGVTICVASGDAGSPDRINEGCNSNSGKYGYTNMNPVFPGGSPWVLSVGATYVVQNTGNFHYQTPICDGTLGTCTNGIKEEGIRYDVNSWTSGAGFTHWDKTPQWQKSYVDKYLSSGVTLPNSKYYNSKGRAYPDVATFGHNCATSVDGAFMGVDGTSCSSPLMAGIVANLNSYQKSRGKPTLGFINPLLYKMYGENSRTFNDITVGYSYCTEVMCCSTDFGYIAAKGWDPVSGLGSPNVEEMRKYLSKY